ncbi:MAG TPA: hypothetical protein VM183_04700 [Burkholderiales bacterium]|nr:hypothetical protein [Burkholderiales bacterium]
MKGVLWFIAIALVGAVGYLIHRSRRQWAERRRASEARLVSLMAQAQPAAPPLNPVAAPAGPAPQERLLLDAASKAGEAGEPVLSIQLYAKLLARYPQSQFAVQARAAVEQQKKKLGQA